MGTILSSAMSTDGTIKRFCEGSFIFKSLTFYNGFTATADGNTCRLGKYYEDSSEFQAKCVMVAAFATLSFAEVDLYDFACQNWAAQNSYIRWIGVIEI